MNGSDGEEVKEREKEKTNKQERSHKKLYSRKKKSCIITVSFQRYPSQEVGSGYLIPSSFVNFHAQQHFDCCNLHLHCAEEISMLRRTMHKIRDIILIHAT